MGYASRQAEEFCRSPHLQGIVSLDLRWGNPGGEIDDHCLEYRARSAYLRDLAYLDISFNNVTGQGLGVLAQTRTLPALQCVSFIENHKNA